MLIIVFQKHISFIYEKNTHVFANSLRYRIRNQSMDAHG